MFGCKGVGGEINNEGFGFDKGRKATAVEGGDGVSAKCLWCTKKGITGGGGRKWVERVGEGDVDGRVGELKGKCKTMKKRERLFE